MSEVGIGRKFCSSVNRHDRSGMLLLLLFILIRRKRRLATKPRKEKVVDTWSIFKKENQGEFGNLVRELLCFRQRALVTSSASFSSRAAIFSCSKFESEATEAKAETEEKETLLILLTPIPSSLRPRFRFLFLIYTGS